MFILKQVIFLFILIGVSDAVSAQDVYTIKADSVKLTNVHCDSTEVIIENHTQGVSGFLYNTGRGRTVFKKGLTKINDSLFLIGGDTLNLKANSWVQGGNKFGATGILGTLDSNHLDLYTNNIQRARLTSTGNLLIGTSDNGYKLNVNGITRIAGDSGLTALTVCVNGTPEANSGVERAFSFNTNGPTCNILNNSSSSAAINELRFIRTNSGNYSVSSFGNNFTMADINCNSLAGLRWKTNGIVSGSFSELEPSFFVWHGGAYLDDVLRIFSNGNVGIGVGGTNNGFKLDVNGSARISGAATFASTTNLSGTLNFVRNGIIDINEASARINFPGDGTVGISTGGTTSARRLSIDTSGRVGIGIMTPTAQFHTTGTVCFAGLTSDTTKTRVLVSDANGNLYYRDASTLAGNGTLYSSLAVSGTVSAKRLKLSQTGWPDYVFDSSYRLISLKELEQYIQYNKHLPGIPSAAEVENKGIDVGDHQAALLKKIEELTLYNIEQEKELAAQNKKLEIQTDELSALKKEMVELKKLIEKRTGK